VRRVAWPCRRLCSTSLYLIVASTQSVVLAALVGVEERKKWRDRAPARSHRHFGLLKPRPPDFPAHPASVAEPALSRSCSALDQELRRAHIRHAARPRACTAPCTSCRPASRPRSPFGGRHRGPAGELVRRRTRPRRQRAQCSSRGRIGSFSAVCCICVKVGERGPERVGDGDCDGGVGDQDDGRHGAIHRLERHGRAARRLERHVRRLSLLEPEGAR